MVLSEAEAEAQLAVLRRQRETLDRTITDLTLYLELGRRLTGVSPLPTAASSSPEPWSSAERTETEDRAAARSPHPPDRDPLLGGRTPLAAQPPSASAPRGDEAQSIAAAPNAPAPGRAGVAGAGTPEPAPMDGALSEGVLARRYGRALIEAALAALDEAGRPLHASEILAALTGRGFSLPGHDPVAALNTRLWKRSGHGGPLRRMGDAVYALAESEAGSASHRDEDEG